MCCFKTHFTNPKSTKLSSRSKSTIKNGITVIFWENCMMQTCINNLQNFKFTIVVSVFHFDSIYEHTVYKPFHMHDTNQNKKWNGTKYLPNSCMNSKGLIWGEAGRGNLKAFNIKVWLSISQQLPSYQMAIKLWQLLLSHISTKVNRNWSGSTQWPQIIWRSFSYTL